MYEEVKNELLALISKIDALEPEDKHRARFEYARHRLHEAAAVFVDLGTITLYGRTTIKKDLK